MNTLDILYVVLSVCIIFLSVPLTMILWRTYKMLDHVESILSYADHVRGIIAQFEQVPMKVINSIMDKVGK